MEENKTYVQQKRFNWDCTLYINLLEMKDKHHNWKLQEIATTFIFKYPLLNSYTLQVKHCFMHLLSKLSTKVINNNNIIKENKNIVVEHPYLLFNQKYIKQINKMFKMNFLSKLNMLVLK
jgi:hypothetical protein